MIYVYYPSRKFFFLFFLQIYDYQFYDYYNKFPTYELSFFFFIYVY